MPTKKPSTRMEERTGLATCKAMLTRDDRTNVVLYSSVDISSNGIRIVLRGGVDVGETLLLSHRGIEEVALVCVWTKPDPVREHFTHAGFKTANNSEDLRTFYSKLKVIESSPNPPKNQPGMEETNITNEQLLEFLQELPKRQPELLQRLNIEHLRMTHNIYPWKFERTLLGVLVNKRMTKEQLTSGNLVRLKENVKVLEVLQSVSAAQPLKSRVLWPEKTDTENGTILIVEDDDDLMQLYSNFLKDKGFSTILCSNGKEGLSKLRQHPEISLVITDIHMPELDGLKFVNQAKADLKSRGGCPPVIVVSGVVTEEILERGKELGVSYWFVKPVEIEELIDAVNTVMLRVAA